MNPKAPVAFNLNFDSLGEAFGFPEGFRDPSFFRVFDRIADLAGRRGVKLSIFVIGRDLENPEVHARVREWAAAGHEIGNHTWSHRLDFGALRAEPLLEEIQKAHGAVAGCTGKEPTGFIAPNWSFSRRTASTLIDLKYSYDTSLFPSLLLYALVGKCALSSWRNPGKAMRLLRRRDWLAPLTRPLMPHFVDRRGRLAGGPGPERLLVLPLPARSRFSPPCWHTLGFFYGWRYARKLASRLLADEAPFYYLIHPADFLDGNDLDPGFRHTLERIGVPLSEKLKRAEEMFDLVAGSGRPMKTLAEIAKGCFAAGTGAKVRGGRPGRLPARPVP